MGSVTVTTAATTHNNIMKIFLVSLLVAASNAQFSNFPAVGGGQVAAPAPTGRQVRLPAATVAVPQQQQRQPQPQQQQFVFNPQQQVNAVRAPQQVVQQQQAQVPTFPRQQQFQAAPQQQLRPVQQQPQQVVGVAPQPVQNNFQLAQTFGQPQQRFVQQQQPQRFVPQQQIVPQRQVPQQAIPQRVAPQPARVPQQPAQQQQQFAFSQPPQIPETVEGGAPQEGSDGEDGSYVHDPSGDATLSRFQLFQQKKKAQQAQG